MQDIDFVLEEYFEQDDDFELLDQSGVLFKSELDKL